MGNANTIILWAAILACGLLAILVLITWGLVIGLVARAIVRKVPSVSKKTVVPMAPPDSATPATGRNRVVPQPLERSHSDVLAQYQPPADYYNYFDPAEDASDWDTDESEVLPNGYTRGQYHDSGASDEDIENWGLDRPGAPPPDAAPWVIADIMDEMDGW